MSGATAAAIRFVFAPGLRFGALGDDAVVRAIPAERFGQLWRNSRALLFIAIWFATNILFGAGLVPIFGEETSIAWEAHIGGFLVGLWLFPLLDRGAVRPARAGSSETADFTRNHARRPGRSEAEIRDPS